MKLLIFTQKVDTLDDNLSFFHRWIEEFAKHCESIIVICLFEGTHDLPKNVRVLSLGKERGVSRLKYLRRFFSYIYRERNNYDAVFVHMNQIYVVLGGLFWRLWNKRIALWYAHGAVSLSLRIATRLAETIFTSTAEGFRIVTNKRHIVGQGIDATLFAQKKEYSIGSQFRLVSSGRITPPKDIPGMIDLVGNLVRENIPATLTLIGSGDQVYTDHLTTYASDKGLSQEILFHGGLPYHNVAATLTDYDVFLNLGKTGSLDKAILDAGAAGLPVVTTNPALTAFMVDSDPLNALRTVYHMQPEERREQGVRLREWVVREHSLSGLVARIVKGME